MHFSSDFSACQYVYQDVHFRLLSLNNSKVSSWTTFHIKLIKKKSLGRKRIRAMWCLRPYTLIIAEPFVPFTTLQENFCSYIGNTLQYLLSHDELPETVYFEKEGKRKEMCWRKISSLCEWANKHTWNMFFNKRKYHTQNVWAYP